MKSKEEKRLSEIKGYDEFNLLLREATQTVEDQLRLEDEGWINLSGTTGDVIPDAARITNLKLSRLYSTKDPLGKQSIRLWTDYTFGPGLEWDTEDDKAKKVLEAFWNSPDNKAVLSARGQRKSSDKLLVDGDIFFALFLGSGGEVKIRWIDPLEITQIITNPDDKEDIKYYKRDWADTLGVLHTEIYRDSTNLKDDAVGEIRKTEDALIYYLNYNTTSQRGNPLLLPALDWIRQYRRFLASRVAVMLALARFAWRSKVKGGQAAVDAIKAKTHEQEIAAGSQLVENLGVDTTPIKTESGAAAAYRDGKMLLHQVCAAVGIPEHYFGDMATGNLATAKTAELPLMKMFQSYQAVWEDTYKDINDIVLAHNKVPEDKWYVDIDLPAIAPADVAQAATALVQILQVMPELADADDVKQIALMTLGVNDPAEVIEQLTKEVKANPNIALTKVLKQLRESLKVKE